MRYMHHTRLFQESISVKQVLVFFSFFCFQCWKIVENNVDDEEILPLLGGLLSHLQKEAPLGDVLQVSFVFCFYKKI